MDKDEQDLEHCKAMIVNMPLQDHELEFIEDMMPLFEVGAGRALTPKQRAWFDGLVARYLGTKGVTISEEELWKDPEVPF